MKSLGRILRAAALNVAYPIRILPWQGIGALFARAIPFEARRSVVGAGAARLEQAGDPAVLVDVDLFRRRNLG